MSSVWVILLFQTQAGFVGQAFSVRFKKLETFFKRLKFPRSDNIGLLMKKYHILNTKAFIFDVAPTGLTEISAIIKKCHESLKSQSGYL